MPDYEFFCRRCEKSFTRHMSMKEHDDALPDCPKCEKRDKVQRSISHFNVQTTRKSTSYS